MPRENTRGRGCRCVRRRRRRRAFEEVANSQPLRARNERMSKYKKGKPRTINVAIIGDAYRGEEEGGRRSLFR